MKLLKNNTFTYGVMPPYEQFKSHYERIVTEKTFVVMNCPIMGNREFTCDELFKTCNRLVYLWVSGDDKSGDWVSCVLSVLEFEWI